MRQDRPDRPTKRLFAELFGITVAAVTFTGLPAFSQVPAPSGEATEQLVFSGSKVVGAAKTVVVRVSVDDFYQRARLAGSFAAQGGVNNDIRVVVTKGSRVLFDSGQRRSVVFSVPCDELGEYVVVLDNRFSPVSQKVVSGTLRRVEWGTG